MQGLIIKTLIITPFNRHNTIYSNYFTEFTIMLLRHARTDLIMEFLFIVGALSEFYHLFTQIYVKGFLFRELQIEALYYNLRRIVNEINKQVFLDRSFKRAKI